MSDRRRVVLLCGPPGAGKSTYADDTALTVYDIDRWPYEGNRTKFNRDTAELARQISARAVVIRAGATIAARAAAAARVGATEVVVLDTDPDTCVARVTSRSGSRQLVHREIAAIREWWARYEPEPADGPGATTEDW